MSPQAQILSVLEKFVSSMNAQVMLRRAIQDAGVSPERFHQDDLPRVCQCLRNGITLFVEPRHRDTLKQLLDDLGRGPGKALNGRTTIAIGLEADISHARFEARRICETLGANGFIVQKVTTIVSELARNIVNYTPGGTIDLIPAYGARASISIRASDSGTGIPDIALVLSGRYKSRTGMGRGLLGCKRLANRFQIESGAKGTQINAEVDL
jgi:serine/threonine-protein kinase RsbT